MAGSDRSRPGGYLNLVRLVTEHYQAFTYDWRARFSLGVEQLTNGQQSMHEALLLTRTLLTDPGSHVYAAAAGWDHPMSREAHMVADLIDITIAAHTNRKHPHRYPRPSDHTNQIRPRTRLGTPAVEQQQVHQALRDRGHNTLQE